MEYRHAAIPAVAGGLMLTLLLWWAGASADALDLDGATGALGIETVNALRSWLNPWAYDPRPGASVTATADGASYLALRDTAMQIRFVAVFLFYAAGALLLVRRLPAERGRVWQALLALWAWGVVAGTLAVTVSAPWMIASGGRGSYRFLPQLAALASAGRTVLVPLALAAAAWTVFVTRVALRNTEPQPREDVPARTAVVAATVGTAVVAVSVVLLSYQANAARIQTMFTGGGFLGEPGDLLRQWLLLSAWSGPSGIGLWDWLLVLFGDVLLLAVVWCALRWLPGMLTRVSVPAMAVCTVCAVVLGLLVRHLWRVVAVEGGTTSWHLLRAASGLGEGTSAAVLWGTLAGVTATVVLRVTGRGAEAPVRAAAGDRSGG
ncbi:hypothetical protein NC658_09925 [Streptomyces griseoincarnatus]|uniref:Integral membrane protein n=1 Tax=Streptomyces griseoincarnatus TaxID=29305 RepID=A0ABT0VQE3_STRGI|nr:MULTISPECIES: hypothetical protein [Streptomyces]MBJ6613623.1 hypothetical protein [Streptomyces sp. I3(2020)]MBJ6629978.1 hypothetical protein [Streptomyces sp. I4(2020)]MCM2513577.1 hypothetical protein [Streptomyces griseoincarnatus]